MANRAPIRASFSNADLLKTMAEGDEQAATIVHDILHEPFLGGHRALLTLDDMNIRGKQITLAYDYCGKSLPSLLGCIMTRDGGMVRHLNDTFSEEKAVNSGASFNRSGPG